MREVDIRGVFKNSLIDYPGKIVSTIFFSRCNFRCPFCHNPELALETDKNSPIDPDEIIRFLVKKKKWLDGVCLTGGEPTLHAGLAKLAEDIKKEGFAIKLDTNGTNPRMLETLIENGLVDYVAMDIKSDIDCYDSTTRVTVRKKDIKKSAEIIRESAADYEFRTTVVPPYFNKEILLKICLWLEGSKRYVLQQFRNNSAMIDMSLRDTRPYSSEQLREFREIASIYFKTCEIRGI